MLGNFNAGISFLICKKKKNNNNNLKLIWNTIKWKQNILKMYKEEMN